MKRENRYELRLSDNEQKRLEAVAAYYGLSVASVIRMLVLREARAIKKEA